MVLAALLKEAYLETCKVSALMPYEVKFGHIAIMIVALRGGRWQPLRWEEQTCTIDVGADVTGNTLTVFVVELMIGLDSAKGNTGGRRGVRVGLELSSSR